MSVGALRHIYAHIINLLPLGLIFCTSYKYTQRQMHLFIMEISCIVCRPTGITNSITGSISNCVVYEPQYSDNPTLWDCFICFLQMHQQKLKKLKSVTFFSGPRTVKGLGGISIWKTNSPFTMWLSSIFWSKYLQVDNDRTLGCILNSQVSSHRRQVSIKAGVWKWKSKEMFLEKEMQFCLPRKAAIQCVCRQGSIKEERVFFSFTQMIQATFCLSHLRGVSEPLGFLVFISTAHFVLLFPFSSRRFIILMWILNNTKLKNNGGEVEWRSVGGEHESEAENLF